ALTDTVYTGSRTIDLYVGKARLDIEDVAFTGSNGIAVNGTGNIVLTLKNVGSETIPSGPLTVTTSTPGSCLSAASGTLSLPTALAPGASINLTGSPLSVTADNNSVIG